MQLKSRVHVSFGFICDWLRKGTVFFPIAYRSQDIPRRIAAVSPVVGYSIASASELPITHSSE